MTRIEGTPVDIVEIVAHLVAHALFRAHSHASDALNEPRETGRVARKFVGSEQEYGKNTDDEEFVEGQSEHT